VASCSDACIEVPKEAPETKMGVQPIPQHIDNIRTLYLGQSAEETPDGQQDAVTVVTLTGESGTGEIAGGQEAFEQLTQDLAKLQTGEEAIKFFAKHAGVLPVEFVYCNRAPPHASGSLMPCALRVVQQTEVQPEHFIISATGIVHVCPGQLSDHMSLFDWMWESSMHNVLCSINVFRLYSRRKAFTQWVTGMRREEYNRRRLQLGKTCFFARPTYVKHVAMIHNLMHNVREVPWLQIGDPGLQHCQIQDFAEMGRARTARRQLARLRGEGGGEVEEDEGTASRGLGKAQRTKQETSITGLLEGLIATVTARASGPGGGSGEATRSSWRSRSATAEGRRSARRSIGMVERTQEAREQARRAQLLDHDVARLGDCVRVVDCMFQSSIISGILRAVSSLEQRLETKKTWFIASAAFGPDDVPTLEPEYRERFLEAVDHFWNDAIRTADTLAPLASLTACQQLDSIPVADARGSKLPKAVRAPPLLRKTLASSCHFAEATARVKALLGEDLDGVSARAAELYAPLARVRRFARIWAAEEEEADGTAEERELLALALSTTDLEEQERILGAFEADLNRVRNCTVGTILLDAKSLRASLAPTASRAREAVARRLQARAREEEDEAAERAASHAAAASVTSTDVDCGDHEACLRVDLSTDLGAW
jgi:hypothetical protein